MNKPLGMTPTRRAALELAKSDVVLLVKKAGTFGSIDTRDEVRPSTARWLREHGYLKLNISHGDDAADGYELTDAGLRVLECSQN